MSNWCSNVLTIKGEKKILDIFKKFAKTKENPLDTEKFVPMPKSLRKATSGSEEMIYQAYYGDYKEILKYDWVKKEKIKTRQQLIEYFNKENKNANKIADRYKRNKELYGHLSWYSWALENWGTKWGICHAELRETKSKNSLGYWFDSAWCPPIPVIVKMSKMFNLKFELHYSEGGCGFKGTFICEKGQVLKNIEEDYTIEEEE